MDREEKQCLYDKIKTFESLENTFRGFIELAKQFIENDNNNTFGLQIAENNGVTYFRGFGHSFFAVWRFLIYDNAPIGELCFYRVDNIENEQFYSLFYDTRGNAKKKIEHQAFQYYLKNNEKFEDLFFDIIKSFFELQCFKA